MQYAAPSMLSAPTPSLAIRKQRRRVLRLAFRLLEIALAFVFLAAVVHHVLTFDFKPLAALCLPILAVLLAITSLLYTRGRSLAKGKQLRSLCAAERALQATIWYLLGIVLGTSLYGMLVRFGVTFNPAEPSVVGFWLLLFLAPYALMQVGLLGFMRAVWLIAPPFFRRASAYELRRRVQL